MNKISDKQLRYHLIKKIQRKYKIHSNAIKNLNYFINKR